VAKVETKECTIYLKNEDIMTFDELQQLAEKDLKIDNLALDLESLKTPALHNKWLKFHNQYTQLLKKAEQDLARLTREKWEYYTGKGRP
tara:strand:+ start:545 stop:811 length:267 start_codon:yes stop_codon:yes gene_type:complete